jgi:hypothetical protein
VHACTPAIVGGGGGSGGRVHCVGFRVWKLGLSACTPAIVGGGGGEGGGHLFLPSAEFDHHVGAENK